MHAQAAAKGRDGNRAAGARQIGAIGEYRIDWGPGYRVYLAKDGDKVVILPGGGTKQRQQSDIGRAKAIWAEYKARKAAAKPKR